MPFQRIHQSVRTVSVGSRIDDQGSDNVWMAMFGISCGLSPFPTPQEAMDSGEVDDLLEWLTAYRLDG